MLRKISMVCMPLSAIILMAVYFIQSKVAIPNNVMVAVMIITAILMLTAIVASSVDIAEKYIKEHPERFNKKK